MSAPRAVYVHVPFCERKCFYCAFNSTNGFEQIEADRYLGALDLELERSCAASLKPETVYIGGGTPTALEPDDLFRLLEIIRRRLPTADVREWTVEANPGTLDASKVRALSDGGVHRVSLGVQTFHPDGPKSLGRIHTAEQVFEASDLLRAGGIPRLNFDLIYARPGQTLVEWEADLRRLLTLNPRHVSAYGLQFEEGTPFGEALHRGVLHETDERLAVEMFRSAVTILGEAGLSLYEVSNFSIPGEQSLHNSAYWRNEPYLGVGPGAFGFVDGVRYRNQEGLEAWINSVHDNGHGRDPEECDQPDLIETARETLVAGLRTAVGVDLARIKNRTGVDYVNEKARLLTRLCSEGLAKRDGERINLTHDGLLVLDAVLTAFLEPTPA